MIGYRTLAGRLQTAGHVDGVAEETVSRHRQSNHRSDNRSRVDSNAHVDATASTASRVICATDVHRRTLLSLAVGRQVLENVDRHVSHVDRVVGVERWYTARHHVRLADCFNLHSVPCETMFMPPLTVVGGEHYVGWSSVSPVSVNT